MQAGLCREVKMPTTSRGGQGSPTKCAGRLQIPDQQVELRETSVPVDQQRGGKVFVGEGGVCSMGHQKFHKCHYILHKRWERHQLPNISRSWTKCPIGIHQVEVRWFCMEGRRHHSQLSWLIVWASVSQKMDESTMTFSFYVHSMQECYSVLFLDQCNNVMTCTVVLLFLDKNEIQCNVLYLNNFRPSDHKWVLAVDIT